MLDKWNQIDDEIWAKVIVFERNRRVAKAYARAPVLTVNGAEDGFDGMRYVFFLLNYIIYIPNYDLYIFQKKNHNLIIHLDQNDIS